MTRSQDNLRREAILGCWKRQGLVSARGGIQRDYFARAHIVIEVRYDDRGRITEAFRRTDWVTKGTPRILEHLGPHDSGKAKAIVSWLQPK